MKMRKITLVAFVFSFLIIGQLESADYQSEFNKYFKSKDYDNQLRILKLWESSNPNDAELYTCFFNFYYAKSREELLTLTVEKPDGESLAFADSTGRVAGYIGSQITTDTDNFTLCIKKIDEGIAHYPNRLDMRFGKIYALGQVKDWDNFTKEIVESIKYSKTNNNNWTWTNNEKKEDGKEFFLGSLQDYQLQLYNTEDDKLLPKMRDIAIAVLEIYPTHIESLSNLSITYMISKDYDKAIDVLIRAENLNPKDGIVLMNLAHAYKMNGKKDKAITYYTKAIGFVDAQSKEFARKQISELKK